MRAPCRVYGLYRSSSRIVSTPPVGMRMLSGTDWARRLWRGIGRTRRV